MKRRIALITAILMLCTILVPISVSADGEKNMEEMIKIVKEKITVPSSYTEFNYSINSEIGKKVWNFSWSAKKAGDGGVSASADENGNIISYNNNAPYNDNGSKLPKVSRQEALEKAEGFLRKVNPLAASQTKFEENMRNIGMNPTYDLHFNRVVNGIPLYGNYVNIEVDRSTGMIRGYNMSWNDNLVFPDAGKAISVKSAQDAYKEKLGVRLTYNSIQKDKKLSVYTAYRPKYDHLSIDAITGEKVDAQPFYLGRYDGGGESLLTSKSEKTNAIALTPEETNAVEKVSKLITKDDAEKRARGFKYIDIPADCKLMRADLSKDWADQNSFLWQLSFRSEGDQNKNSRYANVRIDASTGEIKGFNTIYPDSKSEAVALAAALAAGGRPNTNPGSNSKGKYDETKAKNDVEAFLKDVQPEKFKQTEYDNSPREIVYRDSSELPDSYSFNYIRKVNEAYYVDNSIRVSYDAVNGKIISFDMNWSNIEFPSVKKAISIDSAYEKLFKNIGLELQYIIKYPQNYDMKQSIKPDVKLVYSLSEKKPSIIDAFTGGVLGNDGSLYKEIKPADYKDISGCFAQKQIMVLAENGVAFEGDLFKPDNTITQKDFLLLLSKTINPYMVYKDTDEIEDLYNYMIQEGIVKEAEKNPQSSITREEATKYIIRALKYDKVAEIKGIFCCSFKDRNNISPDLLGYVSIAQGLKVINGSNDGYFNPKGNLSRAQAAVIIYNYMQL